MVRIVVTLHDLTVIGAGGRIRFGLWGGRPWAVVDVDVPVDGSRSRNWVVFHAKGEGDMTPVHPGRRPFGMTNPIFIEPQ